jgi:hypothetical protein
VRRRPLARASRAAHVLARQRSARRVARLVRPHRAHDHRSGALRRRAQARRPCDLALRRRPVGA